MRDILISTFCALGSLFLVSLLLCDTDFNVHSMKYEVKAGHIVNVTKDSLECEFYKQYLTPTSLCRDAGADTINHHNTNK